MLEAELRERLARLDAFEGARPERADARFVREWYAPRAAAELLFFRELVDEYRHADVLRVDPRAGGALGAADDALRPRVPAHAAALSEYWCHKHRRECRPVGVGAPASCAGTRSTRSRGCEEFARVRATRSVRRSCCTATRGSSTSAGGSTGVVTSPPYPGLIDYHEQHRYAYELLGLDDRRELELGAAASGRRAPPS